MKDYLKGIIGGVIGGLIASLPWILMYVYGGYLLSILAAIIALGVSFGWQKLKGKVDKKFPIYITVISLLIVVGITSIVIPLLLLQKEGYYVNFSNLKILYNYSEFRSSIIHDLIISIIFTFLGISGVIHRIKSEVDPEFNKKQEEIKQKQIDDLNSVKEIFVKKNAFDKQNTISKEEIKEQFNQEQLKIFKRLCMQQIIKKSKGSYYFSEKYENNAGLRFMSLYFKIMIGVILGVIIILAFTLLG